jgi:hypothetical protein
VEITEPSDKQDPDKTRDLLLIGVDPKSSTHLRDTYLRKEYNANLASRSSSGGEIGKCEW